MLIQNEIRERVVNGMLAVFGLEAKAEQILVNETKPEFEGDYTIVTFPFTKQLGLKPEDIGAKLGEYLVQSSNSFESFNVIKGFLNLTLKNECVINILQSSFLNGSIHFTKKPERIMVEFASPNTNKPIHFGHLRNIFLGNAVSNLFSTNGYTVVRANLINDRGIHICKSMIAWKRYAQGATPESSGIKGDHLVGDYYVKFNDALKEEIKKLTDNGMSEEDAGKNAPILKEAQELLRKWESGDEETLNLWKTMNGWVYRGFDATFEKMGIQFDKYYYESDTYLLGKAIVQHGLDQGVLSKKQDGSVWIDLTEEGLDEKLLLRSDGTSVYITQDIGTADLKYNDYQLSRSVYVIGDEQNYHMQVLKLIMQRLGHAGANGIHHLSYGMVELPTGRMKSREGTVVDADDMMEEMKQLAQHNTEELGKVDDFSQEERQSLYSTLGLGALKFYLLRVDPKKKMIFNPKESIDFHGYTGPFVQYTHARISSILRKASDIDYQQPVDLNLNDAERKLILQTEQYQHVLEQACSDYNPALVCNYLFTLAQQYNSFLPNHPILRADTVAQRNSRLQLSFWVKRTLAHGLNLLGIGAPERM